MIKVRELIKVVGELIIKIQFLSSEKDALAQKVAEQEAKINEQALALAQKDTKIAELEKTITEGAIGIVGEPVEPLTTDADKAIADANLVLGK